MDFSFNEAAAKTEGGSGGSKVLDTGVSDVVIKTASRVVASTGTVGIDWSIQVGDSKYPNMVYGVWMHKKDGSPIAMNFNPLQGLMGLNGIKGLTTFNKEIEVKGGTKTVEAFKELDGLATKVAIVKVLDIYNGVTEKNEIRGWMDPKTDQTFTEKTAGKDAKQIKYYSKMQDSETDKYKKRMAEVGDEIEAENTDDSGSLL